MSPQELRDFISGMELFADLNDDELNKIVDIITPEGYEADHVLFQENSNRERIYLIRSGQVLLFKQTPLGDEKRIAFFEEGDFLGEGCLIDDTPHSTSARTRKPGLILIIKKDDILKVFDQDTDLARKVITRLSKVISRRMSLSNSRMVHSGSQYVSGETRREHDLLGDRDVPNDVYFGIQTMRALENFDITGVTLNFYPTLIEGLAMVKKAAALANLELKLLDEKVAKAIVQACDDIINGKHHKHFVVDMIQGGAGTSTNMNANEVIANKALEIMGFEKGQYEHCHPNNHVNLSQSTNDAYPTAMKLGIIRKNKELVKVLMNLISAFHDKSEEFAGVIKMGRTQLQDAVPMTLGQAFEAYAITLEEEVDRITQNVNLFMEINMGATAIGTGINTDPGYTRKVIGYLRDITGLDLVKARNLVEATQDTGAFVMYSSALKRLAVKLSKISNDLRLMSSGPRTGLNEINLPPMQPGSSIMPGKVNPVIPEVVNQIAFKVIGNDLTVTMAAEAGQLELNVMEPVIVQSIFESIEMLKNGIKTLTHRCIEGVTANIEVCLGHVMNSIGLVTALNPYLGYEASSSVAKEALQTGKAVYDLVLERKLLSKEKLDQILAPENMIKPRKIDF